MDVNRMQSRFYWVTAITVLGFGVFTADFESKKWLMLGLAAYSLPVLGMLQKRPLVRTIALWIGTFVVAQAIVSRYNSDRDFITLPVKMNEVIDVQSGLPGITGRQEITTDELGFRVTRDIDYNDKTTLRIFAIGASTTAQMYLDDHATWTHRLQEQLDAALDDDVEVINAGVSGLRNKHHVETLKRAIDMNADAIILVAGINNWNWQIKEHFANIDPINTGQPPINRLHLKHTMLGQVLRALKQLGQTRPPAPGAPETRIVKGEFYAPLRGSLNRPTGVTYHPDQVSEDFSNNLKRFSKLCHDAGIPCVIVLQATGYQDSADADFRDGMWMTPPYQNYTVAMSSLVEISDLYNGYLVEFAEERGDIICDPRDAMRASYEHFYDDCHFNTDGAAAFAEALFPCVLDALE
jgi:lysophospholipase L1-like esterase